MVAKYLDGFTMSPRTKIVKTCEIRDMLRDWPASTPRTLHRIKKSDINKWLATYEDLRSSTVNSYITLARQIFQLAVEDKAVILILGGVNKFRADGILEL